MDLRKAHELLSRREQDDRTIWPFPTDYWITVEQRGQEFRIRCDGWSIAATAAASYSGRLNEAETHADLDDLIEYTRTLIDAGDAQLSDLEAEWNRVFQLVQRVQ